MKTPLALALVLSLVLGAGPALAGSRDGHRSAFSTHRDPRSWGYSRPWNDRRHLQGHDRHHRHGHDRHHGHGHGFLHRQRTVIVVPGAHGHGFVTGRAHPVFVPGHWAWWHGHGWMWFPGHWVR